jgi:TrmH family RNA methyltransferase
MTNKPNVKRIKSLQLKKYRQQEQCFVVEGRKGVEALLRSDYEVLLVAATSGFMESTEKLLKSVNRELPEGLYEADAQDLVNMGSFQTNDSLLAVARMKEEKEPVTGMGPVLVLDEIRDPGNMGTMIRTADWFGIRQIVASPGCVDFYNPKVISATMGSFCNVNVCYRDLPEFLKNANCPVYGAFLNGAPLESVHFDPNAIIVIGNESAGISDTVASVIENRIKIAGKGQAESLNASVAAGILLYLASVAQPS